VYSVRFSRTARPRLGSLDSTIKLWDVAGTEQAPSRGTRTGECRVLQSPNGKTPSFTASTRRSNCGDVATRKEPDRSKTLKGLRLGVVAVTSALMAKCWPRGVGDKTIQTWYLRGEAGHPQVTQRTRWHSVAFIRNGRRWPLERRRDNHVVGCAPGRNTASLNGHTKPRCIPCCSPDGRRCLGERMTALSTLDNRDVQ